MAKINKYSIKDLQKDFPTDEKCAEYVFDCLHSRKCSCGGVYKQLQGRRQFQCSKCRYQIAPTAGTIFHKSPTSLTLWFHALFVFSNAKSGISAKQLERELGVTYKCAWRILSQIRKALKQDSDKLKGDVEVDSGYFGGKGYGGKYNEHQKKVMAEKSVVTVAIQRGKNSKVKAEVTGNVKASTLEEFIRRNISKQGWLLTDSAITYERMRKDYALSPVDHHKGEYVRGKSHINNVEVFFAHLKRSIKGTYKSISKKHLQSYLDAFAFHYNNRHNDRERFGTLMGTLLRV